MIAGHGFGSHALCCLVGPEQAAYIHAAVTKPYNFGSSGRSVMLQSLEGNRRSRVVLAIYHGLGWWLIPPEGSKT